MYLRIHFQASSIGRCDKSVREFLEEKYTPALVATENGAVKLAIKALLEVIQSGQKNLQVIFIFIFNLPFLYSFTQSQSQSFIIDTSF